MALIRGAGAEKLKNFMLKSMASKDAVGYKRATALNALLTSTVLSAPDSLDTQPMSPYWDAWNDEPVDQPRLSPFGYDYIMQLENDTLDAADAMRFRLRDMPVITRNLMEWGILVNESKQPKVYGIKLADMRWKQRFHAAMVSYASSCATLALGMMDTTWQAHQMWVRSERFSFSSMVDYYLCFVEAYFVDCFSYGCIPKGSMLREDLENAHRWQRDREIDFSIVIGCAPANMPFSVKEYWFNCLATSRSFSLEDGLSLTGDKLNTSKYANGGVIRWGANASIVDGKFNVAGAKFIRAMQMSTTPGTWTNLSEQAAGTNLTVLGTSSWHFPQGCRQIDSGLFTGHMPFQNPILTLTYGQNDATIYVVRAGAELASQEALEIVLSNISLKNYSFDFDVSEPFFKTRESDDTDMLLAYVRGFEEDFTTGGAESGQDGKIFDGSKDLVEEDDEE
jgi:hypothetical protein